MQNNNNNNKDPEECLFKNKTSKKKTTHTDAHTQIKTTEILGTFWITTETRQNAQHVFWRSEIILSKFNNQSSHCIAITQRVGSKYSHK